MERTWSSAGRLSTDVSDTWGGPGSASWQATQAPPPAPMIERRPGFLTFKLLGFVSLGMILCLSVAMLAQGRRPREVASTYEEPAQHALDPSLELAGIKDYKITATDEFVVEGMIMARERYRTGREADLSPLDFVLA